MKKIVKTVMGDLVLYHRPWPSDYSMVKVKEQYAKAANLHQDQVWLDAGAAIGGFTNRIAKSVDMVVAIEAEPDNARLLMRNVYANNNHDKVMVLPGVLTGKKESRKAKLYLVKGIYGTGMHSIVKESKNSIEVNAYDINSVIDFFGVTAMKIDIQGGEYEVLKAIQNWDNISQVLVEYHPMELEDGDGKKLKEMKKILKERFSYIKNITGVTPKTGDQWFHATLNGKAQI